MTHTNEIAQALQEAKQRSTYFRNLVEQHRRSEPDDHFARQRHERVERKLLDDLAEAETDVALLSRELARAAHSDAEALLP